MIPPTKIRKEHALQRQVKWFAARAVAVPHVFACHDRGAARSTFEHVWEAERGIVKGWPDTELCLNGGRTFRCELKARGKSIAAGSAQEYVLSKLVQLGHATAQADSVRAYAEACERWGVPLKQNWRTTAQLADAKVEADIREQEAKAAEKAAVIAAAAAEQEAAGAADAADGPITTAPIATARPKPRRKPSRAQIARIFTAMRPL